MPDPVTIDDLYVRGNLTAGGHAPPSDSTVDDSHIAAGAAIKRSKFAQDATQNFFIPHTTFRIWDDLDSFLSDSSSGDDMAYPGTAGLNTFRTANVDNGGAFAVYARALPYMPPEYDPFQTVNILINCGMVTNTADTCNVDCQLYRNNKDMTVSSDLISTAAQSMNSTTFALKTFNVTATEMLPGDSLDLRIEISGTDGSVTGVTVGSIQYVAIQCDVRG